jgi:hypothetical protein
MINSTPQTEQLASTFTRTVLALPSVGDLIDELGTVNAELADLEKRKERLRDALIAAGVSEGEGTLFRATVSHAEVSRVDWKAVAEKLEPSRQLIVAHTSVVPRVTVKVVSR